MAKPTKVEKHPFAIVIWDDPNSSSTEVITDENVVKYHVPAVMKTVGWIIKDDEKGISICNEVFYEHDIPNYRGHTFILRSLIRSVTPFKLTSPKKGKPHAKSDPVDPPVTPGTPPPVG